MFIKRFIGLLIFNGLANQLDRTVFSFANIRNKQRELDFQNQLNKLKEKYTYFLLYYQKNLPNTNHKEYQILPNIYDWINILSAFLEYPKNNKSLSNLTIHSEENTLPNITYKLISNFINRHHIIAEAKKDREKLFDLFGSKLINKWEDEFNDLINIINKTEFNPINKDFFIDLIKLEKAFLYFSINDSNKCRSVLKEIYLVSIGSQTHKKNVKAEYRWHYTTLFGENFVKFLYENFNKPIEGEDNTIYI